MFKSYLLTSWRFFRKNKAFSFINIAGLSLGTLCCLYILLYVTDEFGYDRHHTDARSIYRLTCSYNILSKGEKQNIATTAAPLAPLIKKEFAEVEEFTRVVPFAGIDLNLLQYNGKTVYEKDAVYVDSTFFTVFNYHFVQGSKATALQAPYSVVLLKSTADKLFGREEAVGKTITIENSAESKITYTVKAVVDESLGKSHLHANIFVTMNSGSIGGYMLHTDSWTSNTYVSSYIKLRPDASAKNLEQKLPQLVNKYAGEQLKTAGLEETVQLQPVTAVHTTPGLLGIQITQPVSASFLQILLLIALLIQVIACINFMNLSTARASKRAREVGVRKVIGAGRADLVKQFLGESFLLTLISVCIAIPLLLAALPLFNHITHANLTTADIQYKTLLPLLAALVVVTALVAGSYPAFYLSAFRAIKVIKGNFSNHVSATGIRRGLVVFQFVLSIVLISGIVIIYSQLNYIKNKDLGFEKEQRMVFSFHSPESVNNIPAFMSDLRSLAEVKNVSNASHYLSSPLYFRNAFALKGQKEADQKGTDYLIADENFVKVNGIRLVSGRDFRYTDSAKLLVNEAYCKQLGLTIQQAPGTVLADAQGRTAEIVGVMKDFHYGSLHQEVSGFALWRRGPHDDPWSKVVINTQTSDYKKFIARVAGIWHKDVPGAPFSYAFLDEEVGRQYQADVVMSHIINAFTLLAIFISCLGLFGLAAFSAEQRSKEIGIRKVLGASVSGIAGMLSADFLKLIMWAFLIAVPIAYWAMHQWLQGFAFRTAISWWMFLLAGALSFAIGLLTVSFQSVRAATANPVKSLRTE
jgi:putative ABC transport system permease protein